MRTKPKNKITSRADAEQAMEDLNLIDAAITEYEIAEEKEVMAVRERWSAHRQIKGVFSMQERKDLLIRELEAWAKEDRSTWAQLKTLETPFGRLGFRMAPKSVVLIKSIAKNMKIALALLEEALPDFVRKNPKVDKKGILAADQKHALDAEQLRKCGLKVHQVEEFWIETAVSKNLREAAEEIKND